MFSAAWTLAIALSLQSAPPPAAPQNPWPDDRPIASLLINLGEDIGRLPSVESGLTLGVGGIATLIAHGSDQELAAWVSRSGSSSYTRLGGVLGDGWVQGGAAVGTYVVGRLTKHAETTHIGSDLIRAQVLNGVITQTLKMAVHRERPNNGNHRAFPSGHTTASFASAAVLHGHYGWRVGIPAYAMAGFIGWTRVRDNAHYLSDIVMGATVGTIVGRTVTAGHRARTWQVVPIKTPGGFAVYVTRAR